MSASGTSSCATPVHELELCWATVRPSGLAQLVAAAADAGFTTVCPNPVQYLAALEGGWTDASMRHFLQDRGMGVAVIDPLVGALAGAPAVADVPQPFRWLFEITEADCYKAAEALGASTINVAPFLGSPASEQAMVDSLGAVCRRAADHGLTVALEFMPDTGVPTLDAARRITGHLQEFGAGVTFDTWHFARSGGRLEDLATIRRGEIAVLQVNDRDERRSSSPYLPMSRRVFPGHGTLPLVAMLAEISRCEPDIRVGLEVFNDALMDRAPGEVAREGAAATRAVLSQAALVPRRPISDQSFGG